jgi:TonB-linked SusC/RagA family outer membrane protein
MKNTAKRKLFKSTITWSLCLFILLFAPVTLSGASAQTSNLTIKERNITVKEVLTLIEKNNHVVFFYADKDVDLNRRLNINVVSQPISKVLNELFKDSSNAFKIDGKQVYIIKKLNQVEKTVKLSNKTIKISGIISDEKSQSVIGASIILNGTSKGTVTDLDGRFSIEAPEDGQLKISYIGYETQLISIAGRTSLKIALNQSQKNLDEVVVVGYGSMKKSDLAGSISTLSEKDLKNLPTPNLSQLLQGQSAGVSVTNNSGGPGDGSVSIRIRGANSYMGGNNPLFVVDGIKGGNYDPNDVKSVEILKDASATAIYGAQGANGVIMITTKTGTGKPVISYDAYYGIDQISHKLSLMNAYDYANTINANQAAISPGSTPYFDNTQLTSFKTQSTNWQNEIFKAAPEQKHHLSISGGNATNKYYISGSIVDNQGIILNTSYKSYFLSSNLESQITDKFKVKVNMVLSTWVDQPSSINYWVGSPSYSAIVFAPTLPVFQPDGSYSQPKDASYGPPTAYNPVSLANEATYKNNGTSNQGNVLLEYKVLKDLTFTAIGSANGNNTDNNSFTSTMWEGGNNAASISNAKDLKLQNTEQLNFQKAIGDHSLNIVAAYEISTDTNTGSSISGSNFLSNSFSYENMGMAANVGAPSSYIRHSLIESYLSRIAYSYKERYLLTLTGRYDGSSVFSANNKWGFFPSSALGWRISQEKFMKYIPQISNLKLRASYGVTGNQGVGPYSSLSLLSTTAPYNISGDGLTLTPGVSLNPSAPGNSNLKWESTAQYDVGLDLGLLEGKINFTADYYKKKTTNLLLNAPLPLTSGFTSVLENVGEIDNSGFELDLNVQPLNGKFQWTSDINLSANQNKVIKLLNGVNEIDTWNMYPNEPSNLVGLRVGQTMGTFYGYKQIGIWGTKEATQAALYSSIPGAPKYLDINKDGKIDGTDLTVIGNANPKFIYGWNNTFSYAGFSLNVLVQGSYGNDIFNTSLISTSQTNIYNLNRWTPTNQNTSIPSFKGEMYNNVQSSRYIENGSYLRFKNITLGYNLPKSLINQAKIGSCRVYMSLVNYFTITKYSGFDPEASSSGVDGWGAGLDIATYPVAKSVMFGLNVSL